MFCSQIHELFIGFPLLG